MKNATTLTGIQFPVNLKGKRSTTEAGQTIFAASYQHVDKASSTKLMAERKWRDHYAQYLPAMLHSAAKSLYVSEEIAEKGLASCYQQFEFIRNGQTYKLNQAMALFTQPLFRSAKIKGLSSRPKQAISIQHKGRTLSGEGLRQQISVWHDKNIIEKSHAQDLLSVLGDSNKQDLSDKCFVLLGASSEIGPISLLLALGANIVAIGRENPKNWTRLISLARRSSGNLYIPCKRDPDGLSDQQIAQLAGADLLTQTPEIGTWLNSFKMPLTLGNYAYLDGANHVRLVMAMDAIVTRLTQKRDDISLAYLLTPSDVYAVPKSVTQNSMLRFKGKGVSGLFKAFINKVTLSALFSPSIVSQVTDTDGNELGVLDNLVPQQGPNYVLAKRIQRWRAIVSVKNGLRVSCSRSNNRVRKLWG